jgi:hypothetical protein
MVAHTHQGQHVSAAHVAVLRASLLEGRLPEGGASMIRYVMSRAVQPYAEGDRDGH